MRRRLLVALLIGLTSGLLSYRSHYRHANENDFSWAIRLVHDLQRGVDPYSYPISVTPSAYPLTAALVAWPFAWLPLPAAGALFFGLSSALLAFALTRDGTWWRLGVFLSFPYKEALRTIQWSPLLFAVALYPVLLPLTLAKPHIGLPILLTRLNWRRGLACAAFGIISLALLPTWPWLWLQHQGAPDQYVPPLFLLPLGPFLLLGLRRWRDERVRFLLLMSVVPQRLWYDCFLLWILPASPRQLALTVGMSWVGYGAWRLFPDAASWWPLNLVLVCIYFPALVIVLWPTWIDRDGGMSHVKGTHAPQYH